MEKNGRRLRLARSIAAVAILATTGGTATAAMCDQIVRKDFASTPPAEAGLSAVALVRLNEALDAAKNEIRALLVLRDCKVVLERYKAGVSREHNHSLYSVTKSVSATLVGALLYQGKLASVDIPIATLISKPARIPDENWKKTEQISLKNVMQMSSGLAYRHDPVGHPIYDTREDRLAVALAPAFVAEPGTRYTYSDGDVSITGAAIASVAQDDLLSYAKKSLFEPMGMSNFAWFFRDRVGRYPGGWGLRLRPMDMLKLGQLYLQGGEWNGARIFEPGFAAVAWQPGPSPNYALHWWIGSHTSAKGTPYFFANGFKGQRIYVFPEHRLVAVVLASLPANEEAVVMPLVIKAVTDAVTGGPDPAELKSDAMLQALEAAGFRGDIRVKQENQDDPRRF